MAKFLAQRVILGKLDFDEIPTKSLKCKVGKILVDYGLFDLVPGEFLPPEE